MVYVSEKRDVNRQLRTEVDKIYTALSDMREDLDKSIKESRREMGELEAQLKELKEHRDSLVKEQQCTSKKKI